MLYDNYKNNLLWEVIKNELLELEENHDLEIKTNRDYVIGSFVKSLLENDNLVENIAIKLWKIHSHSLYPNYTTHIENEMGWSELEVKEENSDNVDQFFFKKIAKKFFDK